MAQKMQLQRQQQLASEKRTPSQVNRKQAPVSSSAPVPDAAAAASLPPKPKSAAAAPVRLLTPQAFQFDVADIMEALKPPM